MRCLVLIAVVALAAIAGCGGKTIEADGAEQSIFSLVAEQTGFEPDDIECPDDEPAEVGHTFECGFTGPEGPYTVDMEVTEVEGDDVRFQIRSHPSAE